MKNMLFRALRAARLNSAVFAEARDDPETVLHSLGIVALVGMAMGLGFMGLVLEGVDALDPVRMLERLVGVSAAVMTTLVGWVLWSAVAYILAGKFLSGGGGFRGMLRALGISYGPGVLMLLNNGEGIGQVAWIVGSLWVLVAAVVAVHEVNDVDWLGAFLSTLVGWGICFAFLPEVLLRPLLAS